MASGSVIIAGAIMASSALLLVGAYLLFAPGPARPEVMPVTPVAAPVVPVLAKVEPTPGPPQEVTPEMQQRGAESARLALEARRPEFVTRCWAPAAARDANPPRIPLQYNLGFDPTGRLAAVGIAEDRDIHRPDVAQCLRNIDLQFTIAAPGLPLQVEVPFSLP